MNPSSENEINDLPNPDVVAQQTRIRRWRIAMGIGTLIAVLLAVGFRPLYRAGKSWRARQLAHQADAFIQAQQWQDATQKAQAAYQLKSDEPSAIRAVAHLQSVSGHPGEAAGFWRQLRLLKANRPEDDRHFAEDLFRSGAMAECESVVSQLLTAQPDNAENLRLAAKVYLTLRQTERSLDFAQKARQADPASKEGQLLLGLLQVNSPDPILREKGRQVMLELSDDHGKIGLDALTALASQQGLPSDAVRKVIAGLRAHPSAVESHRLTALSMEIELKAEPAQVVLDRAMQTYRSSPPAAQQTFAVWLNGRKEHERVLALLPLKDAFQRKDLLLVHLDALASLKRWEEIQKILKTPGVPMDEAYAQVFLARSATELGDPSRATVHWSRAHLAAAPSPEQMWYVASYAEKTGQSEPAELGYKVLTSNSEYDRGAYAGLLRLAEKNQDTPGLQLTLKGMRERWPGDTAIENDYTYVSLLLGKDLPAGLKTAQKLVAGAPLSLAHRTTLALAHFRLGNSASALAVYQGLNIPWDRAQPSQRAIHTAVLAANGKTNEALAEAATLRDTGLRPEERALLPKAPAP